MNAIYSFRPATFSDLMFMRQTKFDGIRGYVEALWGWHEQEQTDRFQQTFAPERCRIMVIGGVDGGWLETCEESDAVFIGGIYLAPDFRRRGIGTAVLLDLASVAASAGKSLTLRVLRNNPARRLYERVGFTAMQETDTHVIMRMSRAQPAVTRGV